MGRKSKCTLATIEKICEVISETNSDKAAYEAAGIDRATFYRWLNDETKSDFRAALARARDAYSGSRNQEVIESFYQGLVRALLGAVETWTSEETTVLPSGDKVKKQSVKTVKRPPAEWAARIVAPQIGGNYGLEKKDLKLDLKALSDVSNLTDDELATLAARLGLGGSD